MNKTPLVVAGTLLLAVPSMAQRASVFRTQPVPKLDSGAPSVSNSQTASQLDQNAPLTMSIALEKMNKTLQQLAAENADLKKRLAEVEAKSAQATKDLVSVKLLLPGVDKALSTTNTKIAELREEYLKHTHKTNFSYESFAFLNDTPGSNKGNFYVPYIWLNSNPGLNQMQKQQSVQPKLNKTTPPVAN